MRHGLALLLCGALVTAGCQTTRTYVVSRSSLENVRRLPPPKRAAAAVEAWTEAGRRPVHMRYRALRLDDATLDGILARNFDLLRIDASPLNPTVVGGLVAMGVGAALLGLGGAVLHSSRHRDSIDTGVVAWLGLAITGGIHLGVGAIVAGAAASRPLIEPIDADATARRRAGPAPREPAPRGAGLVLRF